MVSSMGVMLYPFALTVGNFNFENLNGFLKCNNSLQTLLHYSPYCILNLYSTLPDDIANKTTQILTTRTLSNFEKKETEYY